MCKYISDISRIENTRREGLTGCREGPSQIKRWEIAGNLWIDSDNFVQAAQDESEYAERIGQSVKAH